MRFGAYNSNSWTTVEFGNTEEIAMEFFSTLYMISFFAQIFDGSPSVTILGITVTFLAFLRRRVSLNQT